MVHYTILHAGNIYTGALAIQRRWRGILGRRIAHARKYFDKIYRRDCDCAAEIQKIWRGVLAKRRVKLVRSEKHGVVPLQAIVRRRAAERRYWWLRHNAINVQAWWRCLVARRTYLRDKSAVIRMQTCYRAAAARDHLRRKKEGAAGFQRIYQGFLGRNRTKARRAEIAAKEQADLEDSAVTVLQRWWRGAEAEMEIEARRIEREMAVEEFAEAAAEHHVQHERLRPNRAKEREADAKAALDADKMATALLKRKRNRATQRKIRAGQRAAKAEQKRLRDELRAINADASSSDSDYIDEESSAEYVLGWNILYIDGNHWLLVLAY